MPSWTVTLTGSRPPDGTVPRRMSPAPVMAKTETESLPPFTAKSRLPSRTTPPWECSEPPVPTPPEATTPAAARCPSAYWSKTWIALPSTALVAS